MRKEICNRIEEYINLTYGNLYDVANFDKKNNRQEGYLHVWKKNGDLIMVIHGNEGDSYNPLEIRLIKVDEDKTIDKQFDTIEELIDYLEFNLMDDLMMYGI